MAQQVQVSFIDDIDGSVADSTVTFVLDRTSFEIDLSEANAARLRDVFGPYVEAARKAGGSAVRGGRRSVARSSSSREDTRAIREWAEAQGMSISARGRISSEVKRAYAERDSAPEPVAEDVTAEAPAKKSRRRSKAPDVTFSGAK